MNRNKTMKQKAENDTAHKDEAFPVYKYSPPLAFLLSSIQYFFSAFLLAGKMDFKIPKAQRYFSGADQKVTNVNYPEEEDAHTTYHVTSQLKIKPSARSSPEALDKEVVLRRLRHHKSKNKIKSAFQALVGSSGQPQEKWMELGDAFTCP